MTAMKTKEIRDLIEFISKTGLNEVNIETDELKISVKRDPDITTQIIESPVVQPGPATSNPKTNPSSNENSSPSVQSAPVETAGDGEGDTTISGADVNNYLQIMSPMIGTFYRSANPESDVFVQVGDSVEEGQTVCIIEAMKLFNEIESEVNGTVVKVLVENADPVEYEQPLFLIDPS